MLYGLERFKLFYKYEQFVKLFIGIVKWMKITQSSGPGFKFESGQIIFQIFTILQLEIKVRCRCRKRIYKMYIESVSECTFFG